MAFAAIGGFLLGGFAGVLLTCIMVASGKEEAEQAASMIYASGYQKGVDDFAARMAHVDIDQAVIQIYLMGNISIANFMRQYGRIVASELKEGDIL